MKAYAGAAPVTRASGKKTSVRVRRVKNDLLATADYGNLNNRMLGSLHYCLQPNVPYDEAVAFPPRPEAKTAPPLDSKLHRMMPRPAQVRTPLTAGGRRRLGPRPSAGSGGSSGRDGGS